MQASAVLRHQGLPASADFLARNGNEVDPGRFLDLFCGPCRHIQLPLSCIFWDLGVSHDGTSGFEVEHLLETIQDFQSYHQLSDAALGAILDYTLECNLTNHIFLSIGDLICLFSRLQSKNAHQILESMKSNDAETFWNLNLLQNDIDFPEMQEIPRDELIRQIVNSDFSSDLHETAKVTEAELHGMMNDFAFSYQTGGGRYPNIAKAVKAVEHFEGIKMRDVQILAVLLAKVARSVSVARLLQMQTGEGKTYVIVAIAISEVLDGNKVDIITSSDTLALTQCSELKALYGSVGITVAENCSLLREQKKKEKIYEADVVYGSASQFMFDALHHDFFQSNIRGDRGYSLAIVDEVDSQMLDMASHSCRFASSVSGMGNLLGIQSTVWMLVYKYFNELKSGDGWIGLGNNKETFIEDSQQLVEYFRGGILEHLKELVGLTPGRDDDSKIEIPSTLWDYTNTELSLWIGSAVEALMKRENFDYCVEEDEVVIVDSVNTGSRRRGMRWDHGMHVFLEMLHTVSLQPENLCMSYISTLSYCKRYGNNLIGLTGTIGGTPSRTFLKDVYSVDFVEIPPFMYWRHVKLPHVICSNEAEWIATVVQRVVEKLNQGRACLVITQYIRFAEVLHDEIRKRATGTVGTYTGSRTDILIADKLAPGTCIIATNSAGRGTDLKISKEVEKAGGLHVVLTSLPDNDRIERQNIGRSARTGQPGTSQMILNWEHVPAALAEETITRGGEGATHTHLVDILREVRDERNLTRIIDWIQQLKSIEDEDNALNEFVSLRNDCVARFKQDDEADEELSSFQRNMRLAINFRFGVYSATLSSKLDPSKVKEDFAYLEKLTMDNVEDCFHDYSSPVFAAWNIGQWCPEEEPEIFDVVLKLLARAIELDPKFAGGAYYIRGIASLFLYHDFQKTTFLAEAIDDFEKSREVIRRVEEQYKLVLSATTKEDGTETKLKSKIVRLLTVCSTIRNNIQVLVGMDVDEELRILYKQQEDGQNTDEIQKSINNLKENRSTLEKGILTIIEENKYEILFEMKDIKDLMPDSVNVQDYVDEITHFEEEGFLSLVTVEYRKPKSLLKDVLGTAAELFFHNYPAARLLYEGAVYLGKEIKNALVDRLDIDWNQYGKVGGILGFIFRRTREGLSKAAIPMREKMPETFEHMLVSSEAQDASNETEVVSNAVDSSTTNLSMGDKIFKKTEEHREHVMKVISESNDVATRIAETKRFAAVEEKPLLDHIETIAANTGLPSDRVQAKYLAEIVKTPIEIEYKGSNGKTRLMTYGKEYNKNSPIRVAYGNSSLVDVVAQAIEVSPSDLKKGLASYMLANLPSVESACSTSAFAKQLICGVNRAGQSVAAKKQVDECETVADVIYKSNWRKYQADVVDDNRAKFDNNVNSELNHFMSDYLNKHGIVPPNGQNGVPQCEYIHENSSIYEVHHASDRPRRANKIFAYRANPSFMVKERCGAVHCDRDNYPGKRTSEPQRKQLIWQLGEPADEYLREIYCDYPDFENILIDCPCA